MRLLHFDDSKRLTSTDFSRKIIPPYAILSHTWSGDEFLFDDLVNNTNKFGTGHKKILFCGEQAACDNLQYFWVDTCCIDKWNLSELSNAINSMYQWYKNAAKCYVFLTDVSTEITNPQLHRETWDASFRASRWFTRGWTLQELIAPASVEFFSSDAQRLGDKESLEPQIHEITGIPIELLRGGPLENFSLEERKKWMEGRETREEEDMAYALIGILQVSMEFKYGEGKERALSRLDEEVDKVNTTPFIVPFDKNNRFVGRESQLDELEGMLFLESSTRKVAITGLGGIGKTQLALALAYRTRQERENCSVFWIPANDIESHHQAYTQIARRLNILGWDNEKVDVKKLVQLHLSKENIGQWLLVFDNVEDDRLEMAGSSKRVSLIEYLPSSKQGAIVFITSDRDVAATLASPNIVELPEKEHNLAQRILRTYLTIPASEQGESNLLLQELAYLPLAIVQAAAYMNVNKIRLKAYLSLLAKQTEAYGVDSGEEYNNGQHPSITTTWRISFEQIQNCNTLAADNLLFMACIDRKDIPLVLLPTAPSLAGTDPIETLHAYRFITKRPAESALDLHRLVHLATRNWLQSQELLSKWTGVAITRLLQVFPDDNHGNRSKWRRLLPHTKFALSSELASGDDESRMDLVDKCARTLLKDGRYNEAEEYFQEVTETRKRMLGQEHPDTLTSMSNLASTYSNQGRWKEAEDLEVVVVEIRKRVLGKEHLDTLTSMSKLASTYSNQGRWKEAEDVEVLVMETRKRLWGQEHLDTLNSMANLAWIYSDQCRWKEAEGLEVLVMETRKRVLGQEHPDMLTSMSNLASTYSNQGRWKEAEDLGLLVIETMKSVLGQEHPDTLTSMANLALIYSNQGRLKEAEDLGLLVIETRKRVLGQEHPDTLTSMSNLALTYSNQSRWKEAEDLEVLVTETRKRVLGQEHPDTLTSIADLVSIYSDQGRFKEAEDLGLLVIETMKRVLGQEHPDTLTSMSNLASTYSNQNRWKEAEDLEVLVTETRKRVLGQEHPDTLTSMANLAVTWKQLGRRQEAVGLLENVLRCKGRY